ncbi:MAG: hypothetical protein QME06_04860 [Desulfobacterales bacterium]|nr:hypothetical protein [Desulfobacterales bacterium]
MNRNNNNIQACDLLSLLKRKLGAFKAFLSATALLRDADLQEMEKIETLIAERENCIKVIKGIDGGINRIKNSIPALPGEAMKKIRTLKKAIDDTAADAADLNKEFETMFISYHDDLKDRLSKTRNSRKGVKNYAIRAYGVNQPRFLDVRS